MVTSSRHTDTQSHTHRHTHTGTHTPPHTFTGPKTIDFINGTALSIDSTVFCKDAVLKLWVIGNVHLLGQFSNTGSKLKISYKRLSKLPSKLTVVLVFFQLLFPLDRNGFLKTFLKNPLLSFVSVQTHFTPYEPLVMCPVATFSKKSWLGQQKSRESLSSLIKFQFEG